MLVNPSPSSSQTLSLGATYLNPSGTAVSSATLAPVSAMILTTSSTTTVSAPVNLGPPTISGAAQQGQTLSASAGTWSNSPTSYAYQWKRCDTSGANKRCDTSGATSASYLLASGDVGATIRVIVTASNSGGSSSATSPATATVAANTTISPPVNLTLPTISGTLSVGQTLTVSTGTWTGSPTLTYQWLACNRGENNCQVISGATANHYLLSAADIGSTFRVDVFARNSAGTTVVHTANTGVLSRA